MALPTPAQVRTYSLSDAFNAVSDARIEVAVEMVGLGYGSIAAEPEHTIIVALHACHWLALVGAVPGVNPGGVVTSATAGGVSMAVGIQAPAIDGGLDDTTPWGRMCLQKIATLPPSLRSGGWSPWA